MNVFSKDKLALRLGELSVKQQLVFGASCCERMMGVYETFLEEADIQSNELKEVLSVIWSHLDESQSIDSVNDLKEKAYSLIPDSEAYETDLTGHAQHICISVFYILELIEDNDLKGKVVDIAALIIDSVDWVIQDSFEALGVDEYTEEQIACHPLMQKELNHQSFDVSSLIDKTSVSTEVFAALRENAINARFMLPVLEKS